MRTCRSYQLQIAFVFALLLVFAILPITAESTGHQDSSLMPLTAHSFWLNPLTSQAYSFECQNGDILEGSFTVTTDGDLFIYDQKKYDLWVGWGDGVDLYIFDEQSYQNWSGGFSAIPLFTEKDLTDLSWRISVPEAGNWYVVYDNDSSIYGKQVEGAISHISKNSALVLGLIVIAVTAFIIVLGLFLKRR